MPAYSASPVNQESIRNPVDSIGFLAGSICANGIADGMPLNDLLHNWLSLSHQADYLEAILAVRLVKLIEMRDTRQTGDAPSGPKVQQHNLPT